MKRSSTSAHRSRSRDFSPKTEHGSRVGGAVLKGLQDLTQHLVPLVSVARVRPVEDVAQDVTLTSMSDKARGGFLEGLPESFVRVARRQLHT